MLTTDHGTHTALPDTLRFLLRKSLNANTSRNGQKSVRAGMSCWTTGSYGLQVSPGLALRWGVTATAGKGWGERGSWTLKLSDERHPCALDTGADRSLNRRVRVPSGEPSAVRPMRA